MQKSLAKNSIYNLIYTGGNIIFPFLTSIYVSRILQPSGVGQVAYAQNIASYFMMFAALGLPSYGVREFAKVRENLNDRNKMFTELILINLFSTTLAVVGYIFLIFMNGQLRASLPLFAVCGLSIFFNYINIDWLYQGMEEYGYITGRSLVVKIVSFVLLLMLVRRKQDFVIYALISSLALGTNYLFNVAYARHWVHLDFKELNLRRHVKPLLWVTAIIFLSSIYFKIDTTMLGSMATKECVGFYTYAQKTIAIITIMGNAVTASLLPRLSFYYDQDREGFFRLLDKGFSVLCFTLIPMCVGIFLVANRTVLLFYGEKFAPAAQTIRIMCPLILIKGFGDLYGYQLAYSTRNEKIIVPASAGAAGVNVVTNSLLIPRFLQNGAVIASVFSELVTNIIQVLYIKRKVTYRLSLSPMISSILSTGIMALCVLFIESVGAEMKIKNTTLLFLEIICGAIVYLLMNILQKNELLMEIFEKIKAKIVRVK